MILKCKHHIHGTKWKVNNVYPIAIDTHHYTTEENYQQKHPTSDLYDIPKPKCVLKLKSMPMLS